MVYLYSTIKMMHGPINLRLKKKCSTCLGSSKPFHTSVTKVYLNVIYGLTFSKLLNNAAWWSFWWTETCSTLLSGTKVLCLTVHFLCTSFTVKTMGWIWIHQYKVHEESHPLTDSCCCSLVSEGSNITVPWENFEQF